MIGSVILILVLYLITYPILQGIKHRLPWFSLKTANALFWYHIIFAGLYYLMTLTSRSDSVEYFNRPQVEYDSWFDAYTTGTRFIEFVGYPFINFLGFTYEMMMVLFAWMGFWGFVFFLIFFRENITYRHKWQGFDLVKLFLFLPNMHFWTASLGKGSIIFMGLGMAIYGLSKLKHRQLALIIGLAIVYHVRPHVFLFMVVGILVGLFTGQQKVPVFHKVLAFTGSAVALALMYDKVIAFAGLDSENLLESFDQFSNSRSGELAKANSGIDISNYPLVFKLFTFWFRPLFVDAPGLMGLIVSVENLLLLLLSAKLFKGGFLRFIAKSSALVKTSAVLFLATSFAMAETLSNMGIIIRQKSMVMYFFLFVLISFLDYRKHQRRLRWELKMKEAAISETPILTVS